MPPNGAVQSCPLKKKKKPPVQQDPQKHWINFKLQDPDGKPARDVTLRVVLPNKKVVEYTSDENGLIEIKNVDPPGNCEIEYDWKKVKVFETVLIQ
jgi:hypothetical protein